MELVAKTAKQTGALGEIKGELAEMLEAKGLPGRLYLVAFATAPTPAWLREHKAVISAEGGPIPGTKNGTVMYNFQGKGTIANEQARVQGNCFLPDIQVDPMTHAKWVTEKKAKAAQFEERKLAKAGK